MIDRDTFDVLVQHLESEETYGNLTPEFYAKVKDVLVELYEYWENREVIHTGELHGG